MDAAFDPTDSRYLYVLPVTVRKANDNSRCPYYAAAKLELLGDGNFELVNLYGYDPNDDPDRPYVEPDPILCSYIKLSPDKQGLRELAVDGDGTVYVLTSRGEFGTRDSWLLAYDKDLGTPSEQAIPLTDVEAALTTPTALATDLNVPGRLYLGVVQSGTTTSRLYRVDLSPVPQLSGYYDVDYGSAVDPAADRGFGHQVLPTALLPLADGRLLALSLTAPVFDQECRLAECPEDLGPSDGLFTSAAVAVIPADAVWSTDPGSVASVEAAALTCDGLALPISAVAPATPLCSADYDVNGDSEGVSVEMAFHRLRPAVRYWTVTAVRMLICRTGSYSLRTADSPARKRQAGHSRRASRCSFDIAWDSSERCFATLVEIETRRLLILRPSCIHRICVDPAVVAGPHRSWRTSQIAGCPSVDSEQRQ